ncbi:MAG: glycosyltransferase [Acidimicrobiia bacterium]|nr:glycosyltransferase [Acidimicrobiia bacterium]
MKRLLVLTTIHDPDDPRVRERTLASLAEVFQVDYATRAPGPTRQGDHTWIELRGNRIRRWFGGLRLMLSGTYSVVSIHDPELIPAALMARLLRRQTVVVDVHEHVPGQILHKDWVWRPLRRPVAWLAARLLRLAERYLVVTLAEDGYQVLFKHQKPVFANYPAEGALPAPVADGGYLSYVGVVNEYRGATLMVEAAGAMEHPLPLMLVGRVTDDKAAELSDLAASLGVDLTLAGPRPHREAMAVAAAGTVGMALMADVPNNRWSQPTKLWEYLGMGVPLVASRLPGIEKAMEGHEAVRLVAPGDAAAAARAIEEIVADGNIRATAARKAAAVAETLVWPAAEIQEFYLGLTGD